MSGATLSNVALIAAFVIGLVWLRPSVTLVPDVSWIISLCERLLHGERLYSDIWEVNPPATVWLYLPFVALSQAWGLRPETVINAEVWILAAAMIGSTLMILTPTKWLKQQNTASLFWLAASILIVMPANSFGEREHFCVLLILPALALLVFYGESQPVTPVLRLFAGVCAGAAIAINPTIGLIVALTCLGLCWHQKGMRFLWKLEVFAAISVLLAYGVAIEYLTPDFFSRMLPLLISAYLPDRVPFVALMVNLGIALWVMANIVIFIGWRNDKVDSTSLILMVASIGGFGHYLVQGKGWQYHSLPMLVLVTLALAFIVTKKSGDQCWPNAPLLQGLATFCCTLFWFDDRVPRPNLSLEISRLSHYPTLLAISGYIAIGHPLVRLSHGAWVGRECSQWAFLAIARQHPKAVRDPLGFAKTNPRLAVIIATETSNLALDIEQHRPDIILVDHETVDWAKLANKWPAVQLQLAKYADHGTFDQVEVFQRITQ